MSRWIELFEGSGRLLSMMRLTVFLSFWPASYVLITHPTENMLLYYLGAYVIGFIGGKGVDTVVANKQLEASGNRDSLGDSDAAGGVVEKRRSQGSRPRKRPF